MYICDYCGKLFITPVEQSETTEFWGNIQSQYYEVSPCCKDSFRETYQCDCCGEYIEDTYIETKDGLKYCSECYSEKELE